MDRGVCKVFSRGDDVDFREMATRAPVAITDTNKAATRYLRFIACLPFANWSMTAENEK